MFVTNIEKAKKNKDTKLHFKKGCKNAYSEVK